MKKELSWSPGFINTLSTTNHSYCSQPHNYLLLNNYPAVNLFIINDNQNKTTISEKIPIYACHNKTKQNQMTKVFLCHVLLADVKVAATSLKLEVRLHALTLTRFARTHGLV